MPGGLSPCGLLLLQLLGLVALHIVTILPYLALGALLRPAEITYSDLRSRLVHIEADVGADPDHRPAQENVAELLGQLAAESVQDLCPDDAGLDGCGLREGRLQGEVVVGQL